MQPTMRKPTRRDYSTCFFCRQSILVLETELEAIEGHADMGAVVCPHCNRRGYVELSHEIKPRQ